MLRSAPYGELASTIEKLLDSRQPLDIQLAAVAALSSADDPGVSSVLLANFASHTPKVQSTVIGAIFSRKNRLAGLLEAMEQKRVPPSSLDAIQRVHLTEDPNPEIRRRAKALLAGQSSNKGREQVLARYRAALAGPRDPKRGKQIFEKQCT
ncbi:MAG: hypothetical protein ABIK89_08080, partial [Planctomycetota bacterium]